MTTEEKRKHYRVDSQNLLNYALYDNSGNVVKHGMGKTLNVSETGILLETHILIDTEYTLGLTVGFEEKLIDIRGKVVFSRPGKEGKFESGINFFEIDPAGDRVLKAYIKAFRSQQ